MTINPTGDVGIGTTPQTAGPTWRTLFVGASATIVSRQSAAGYDSIFANNYYVNSSNQDRVRVNAPSSRMFLDGNNIRFQISPINSTAPSWSEIMRIDDSGNVGIGITSPKAKLDVDGDVNTTGYNSNTLEFSTFFSSGTTTIATLSNQIQSTTAVANIEYVGLYAFGGTVNVGGILMAITRYNNVPAWSSVDDQTVSVFGDTSKEPTLFWDNGVLKLTVASSVQITGRIRITYHDSTLTRNHSA